MSEEPDSLLSCTSESPPLDCATITSAIGDEFTGIPKSSGQGILISGQLTFVLGHHLGACNTPIVAGHTFLVTVVYN
jgi:hypothetical protein